MNDQYRKGLFMRAYRACKFVPAHIQEMANADVYDYAAPAIATTQAHTSLIDRCPPCTEKSAAFETIQDAAKKCQEVPRLP